MKKMVQDDGRSKNSVTFALRKAIEVWTITPTQGNLVKIQNCTCSCNPHYEVCPYDATGESPHFNDMLE